MSVESLRDYEKKVRKLAELTSIEKVEFFEYQPILLTPPEFNFFRTVNKTIFHDARFPNLVKLYSRFHPSEKITEENAWSKSGFRGWLRQNDLDSSFMEKGKRLILPHGLDEEGNMIWDCLAVLPQKLQRQLQEASISKMIDSQTQKTLHEDVDLIILGASVGSNIALALVAALGVEHITIVDPKRQDGVGSSRVGNPSYLIHGESKAIALRRDLLLASPYLQSRVFPIEFGPEIADEVFKGTMPENPNRIVVIIEEMDNLGAKDYLREEFRKRFVGTDKKAIICSVADTGPGAVVGVVETPADPPYNGNALKFSSDPYAKGANQIAKIMETYALVTPSTPKPKPEDIAIPAELPDSLGRLLRREINSFEQSGLASRLSGPVVGMMVIAFLEGRLGVKNINLDLSKPIDARWKDRGFIRKTHREAKTLQTNLGIKCKGKKR